MTSSVQVPEISVCVATRNRAHLLPRLVAALEQQQVHPSRFEVIITDDASTDRTGEVLEELSQASPLRIRVLRNASRGGPASSRNRAWRASTSELIAFTDDDCVPTPGWLGAHLSALAHVDISQGKVLSDPDQNARAGPMARRIAVIDENGLYETCNICYRRAWLERLGGFDAVFRRAGEDADLAWRAKLAGATTAFSPEALVYHDVDRFSWRRELRHTRRWEGVVLLVARHPHLRARFAPGKRTWRDYHRPALLAVGGLALMGRGISRRSWTAALGAAATTPYAWIRLHGQPIDGSRRDRLRLLFPMLTIDASEATVVIATEARLRLRTLTGRTSQEIGSNCRYMAISGNAGKLGRLVDSYP